MNTRITITAAALIALGALAACGRKETESAPANSGPPVFQLTGNDSMKYNLNHLDVKAGEKVTVDFTNIGSQPRAVMAHNFTLLKLGVDAAAFDQAAAAAASTDYFPEKLADEVIAHSKLLGPKQTDEVVFTAPTKPGNYTYLCTFPGHYQAGMTGILEVH